MEQALPAPQSLKGIFLRSSSWEPAGVPDRKAHEVVEATLRLQPPGISHCHITPHSGSSNFSKLPLKCSYQFMVPAASVLGWFSRCWLCFSGCPHVFRFQSSAWPSNLSSLIGPRKTINFQFVQFFLVIRTVVMAFKLCMCCSWVQQSQVNSICQVLLGPLTLPLSWFPCSRRERTWR